MSVAAVERLHLQQLWADETLGDSTGPYTSTGSAAAATAAAGSQTAFADPVLKADWRVLKEMLNREDRERASVVMVTGYESRSTDLRLYMRRIVVRWMFEVTEEQQCEHEVFPLSVVFLDHVVVAMNVTKNRLQLVAAVCMFIASKFRDSVPLSSRSLVAYTDNSITIEELLLWELLVLDALKWNVHQLTPHDYIDVVLCRLHLLTTDQAYTVKRHAQTFVNVCIIDNKFNGCPPSLVATACIYVAVTGLKGSDWCNSVRLARKLHKVTAIDQDYLRHWSDQIENSWRSMMDNSFNAIINERSTDQTTKTDETNYVSVTSDDVFQSTTVENKMTDRVTSRTPSDVREINLNDGCTEIDTQRTKFVQYDVTLECHVT